MFLAVHDLRATRGRFSLMAAVVALVALLTTLLTGLSSGLVDSGISGMRRLPINHLAFSPGSGAEFSRSRLSPGALRPWLRVASSATPIGVSFVNGSDAAGPKVSLALFGADPRAGLEPSLSSGHPPGPDQVVISPATAARGVHVGDRLILSGSEVPLIVVGTADTGTYGHANIAFTSLPTWQRVAVGGRDVFSAIGLRLPPGIDLARVDALAGTQTYTRSGAYAGSPGYSAETATMALIRGFLYVIAAVMLGSFFVVWTVERARQIALLKALGATTAYIARSMLVQAGVVLVTATAAGTLAGIAAGRLLGNGVPFDLQPGEVAVAALLLVVFGVLGALSPLRRITKVDPVAALRVQR